MIRNLCISSLVSFALLGCSSSDDKGSSATTIWLSAAFSKTGVSAVTTWNDALLLAADDASEGLEKAGFPGGVRVKFDVVPVADTKNDPAITVARAQEMVKTNGAKIVINGTSSDTVALGKLAYDDDPSNDLNVPIACVACSSPALHNPNATHMDPAVQGANRNTQKWIFGLAMSSVPQSRVLWNILVDSTPAGNEPGDLNGDGVVKISTIALDDAFGTGFQDAMLNVVTAASPAAIYERTKHPRDANLNEYDWASAVELLSDDQTDGVQDAKPDVIIEFTFPQFSLALVKAYASDIPFLHTHSMREKTVVLSAENKLEGQEGTSYIPSDGVSGQMFDARFRDVLKIARQSQWDSDVYDAGFLFALGTVKAAQGMADPSLLTGAQIRDAMLQLNEPGGEVIRVGPDEFAKGAQAIVAGRAINYEGASGPCDFDAYGRARNRISHWQVKNGEVVDLATYDCIADDACPRQ
ncbi:MAG: ABC transporter substrate-binding protein [Myxococcota bacterium]